MKLKRKNTVIIIIYLLLECFSSPFSPSHLATPSPCSKTSLPSQREVGGQDASGKKGLTLRAHVAQNEGRAGGQSYHHITLVIAGTMTGWGPGSLGQKSALSPVTCSGSPETCSGSPACAWHGFECSQNIAETQKFPTRNWSFETFKSKMPGGRSGQCTLTTVPRTLRIVLVREEPFPHLLPGTMPHLACQVRPVRQVAQSRSKPTLEHSLTSLIAYLKGSLLPKTDQHLLPGHCTPVQEKSCREYNLGGSGAPWFPKSFKKQI